MQNEKQDILYRAAAVWKELTGYHYRLTYGYKGELHQINLTFAPEDFPHLAGFHYLKDLALPRYNPRKTVDMILSGKITHETVRKGAQYRELVEPRLMALVRLKEILEQDFDLFSNHGITLKEAKSNFSKFGACEKEMLCYVRPPRDDEKKIS